VTAAPAVPPRRIGAAWFLGMVAAAFVVFAWMRGAGRIVIPLLLAFGTALLVARALRAVLRPLP